MIKLIIHIPLVHLNMCDDIVTSFQLQTQIYCKSKEAVLIKIKSPSKIILKYQSSEIQKADIEQNAVTQSSLGTRVGE